MHDSSLCVAAIQSASIPGDVSANVARHVHLVEIAAQQGADVIVFPELSLMGYEPTRAAENAVLAFDSVLTPLQTAADRFDVLINVGVPLRSQEAKPFLASLVFRPADHVAVYRKRFLHPGEEQAFSAGDRVCVVPFAEEAVGVAICADINHANHARDLAHDGATMIIAGVAMTPGGIQDAETVMAKHARQHQLVAAMANYAQPTGGYEMAGRSAIWAPTGRLIAQADGGGEAMVLAERSAETWAGSVVPVHGR